MINGRIYSNKTIDNPTRYLEVVFGSYWTDYRVIREEGVQVIGFTATEECRRLCEMSRNIEIITPPGRDLTVWEDGSPVSTSDSGERIPTSW